MKKQLITTGIFILLNILAFQYLQLCIYRTLITGVEFNTVSLVPFSIVLVLDIFLIYKSYKFNK